MAGVVPVVDGLGDVDALVTLQPDQRSAQPGRQNLGDLRLADPGGTGEPIDISIEPGADR